MQTKKNSYTNECPDMVLAYLTLDGREFYKQTDTFLYNSLV